MRRSLLILMVLAGLLMQASAAIGMWMSGQEPVDHATLHWQGVKHHHHSDGSVAMDDSRHSLHHVALDDLYSAPALWTAGLPNLPKLAHPGPVTMGPAPIRSVYVDRLRRPPRKLL